MIKFLISATFVLVFLSLMKPVWNMITAKWL